jgi:hypothetical protein
MKYLQEINMFKLIRLAVYGLIGYGLYHFVTDVINSADQGEGSGQGRGGRPKSSSAAPTRMTGKRKSGKPEETHDTDGGTTRHRVGRGVV